jgi:tetratricopeptide (TPR) repeat protein
MNELNSLIRNLEEDEVRYLESVLRKGLKTKGNDETLVFKLFQIILKGELSARKQSLALYSEINMKSLAMLKSRLFAMILDGFSMDSFINKIGNIDSYDRHVIKARKKMIQFRILYRKKFRADFEILYHVLNEVISEARAHEQFDVLVEALSYKKYMLMLRKGLGEAELLEPEILYAQTAHQNILRANDQYFHFITNQDLIRKIKPADVVVLLEKAIADTKTSLKSTDSYILRYLSLMFRMALLQEKKQFLKAITLCKEVGKLVKDNKVLFTAERQAFIYDNQSLCELYIGSYSNALKSVQKGIRIYSKNNISRLFSRQQEFYCLFYLGRYQEALTAIMELEGVSVKNKGEFRHDKFLFLQACVLFKLGKPKESLRICNKTLRITKDKGRWDLGIRYLKLQCLLELERYDEAYDHIESLRKNVSRREEGVISVRDKLLYKLLSNYATMSFSKANRKMLAIIDELQQKMDVRWVPMTHEVMPLDNYIKQRLKVML